MQVHEKLEKENVKLKARVQELELLNKWYTEQLKLLRQKQFGTSSEKNNTKTPVITAKAPKSVLPKSMVSAELLAYIMSQKFVNAMPLYRQEQDFKRLGVKISRQNLSNWVI